MLRITAVSAGAVEYLIRGSGCAHHEQVVDLDHGAVADTAGASTGAGPVVAGQGRGDAAGYFDAAVRSGETPGRWMGSGLAMVGTSQGQPVDAEVARAVFGRLEHPASGESLGRPPRRFKTYQQRLAAAVAREPLPTPERLRELELAAKTDGRKAVAYYDFTFSAVKSVSVYYAALLADGFLDEADLVVAAHRDAVAVAVDYAESHAAYVRVGYHGRTAEGRSVGRYEAATGLVMTAWDHSTNREAEPQLHTHVAVLNRAVTRSDGQIRALDGRGFRPIKEAVATAYERALEQLLGESLGVVFATRPDGIAREILGVDPNLCAEASTRRAQVLARLDELTVDHVQRHGRAPGPQARKAHAQQATLDTRAAKTSQAGPIAVLAWAQQRQDAMAVTVEGVADAADRVAATGHPDRTARAALASEGDWSQVLAAAVAQVQARYASWTIGNLIASIDSHLPADLGVAARQRPRLLEDMAGDVVAGGNGFGVLQLTAADPVPVPTELRRPDDGRLVFRPHIDERYATADQLATEVRVVAAARAVTAPAITGPDLELLTVELAAAGLGRDQVAAVAGIVSSGRVGDVLIGPAGAGKSRTVTALARVWAERFGGRVLGLATSQHAAEVLAEDGLPAMNIAAFLHSYGANGRGSRERVGPGDLFVIDEVSMASTADLARIIDLVRAGGGKVVFTGDHHQLGAIGAGGLLSLLVADNGAFELQEIRRFTAAWEGPASTRLRVGDVSVLTEYEDRGRLRGGTVEEMQTGAVRGYLTDTIAGQESLLIVGSNQEASALSQTIRHELIALGRVDSVSLGALRDGSGVSAGDLVQARRIDRTIPLRIQGQTTDQDASRAHVINRETYRVVDSTGDGGLLVVRADGAVARLPAGYVAAHVTLAYASTVHAAQGRTVDTAHALLGEETSREAAYVALTRGRDSNIAYLTTTRAPDTHDPERLADSVVGRMAAILERTSEDRSAEWERRVGEREGRSLAWIGGIWDQISTETAQARYTDVLPRLLPPDVFDQVVAEPGYPRLLRAVREAELAGHNPDVVLSTVVPARGGLGVGESAAVSDVLRWRIRFLTRDRAPEQEIDPSDWTTWAPPIDGPVGQFLHDLAVIATDRQAELGHAAAVEQPAWATRQLGTPPDEPSARAAWERAAGATAAYRELASIDDASISLGPAPSREQVLHRALWVHAATALDLSTEDSDLRAAPDAVLYEYVAAWERAQAWAPTYVADDLRAAHLTADRQRRDAVLTAAELTVRTAPTGDDEPRAAGVAETARSADQATELARHLEHDHTVRTAWTAATADIHQRARMATEELERRGQHVTAFPAIDSAIDSDADPADPADAPLAGGRDRQGTEPADAAELSTAERSPTGGMSATASTVSDIARIQQQTRDILEVTRSQAREAAGERLRIRATASAQPWRDRNSAASSYDASRYERRAEQGAGVDFETDLARDTAGDDAALDLD